MKNNTVKSSGQQLRQSAKLVKYQLRLRWLHLKHWWIRRDRRYGLKWRAFNMAAAILILISVVIPVVQQFYQSNRYQLSADAAKLVGNSDPTLTKQLTYDDTTQTYQFNKDAVKTDDTSNPLANLKSQVGTAAGTKNDKSLYSLDIPKDMSKGVTYHDVNSQLSFSLLPKFNVSPGKQVQGHLLYPLSGGNQVIYTLKNNGLKEDIVVPKVTTNQMIFSYTLHLPKTLEARVIPDSGGAIGIYSADPALFGDISYGSSKDQTMVEKARENGAKTQLVFGLPAPIIKAADGKTVANATARFELNGNQLSVVADGLGGIVTPITIDPSVIVTSTSDFQSGGNNDSNIDFSTSGQITRGALNGGSISAGWSPTASFSGIRYGQGTVVYNGYIYVAGGLNGATYANDVQYAALNTSNGTVGPWNPTTGFTTGRTQFGIAVYNGYLYILGGLNGSTYYNSVQYAPINSDGSISSGSWVNSSSFSNARRSFRSLVYNNYLYVVGGYDGTTYYNDVQYAPLNADGSVGSWAGTSSFTTARSAMAAIIYNGYMYILGGQSGTIYGDVQYAPINSNGTITSGSWATTTSLPTTSYGLSALATNGYMYIYGGTNGTAKNTTYYAIINGNGSIGSWIATSGFTNNRVSASVASYAGYVYILGGYDGSSTSYSDAQYAKIDSAGQTSAYASVTPTFTTGRTGQATVAYNGYLYMMGGETSNTNQLADLQYTTFTAAGGLGTWTTQSAAISKRSYFYAAAYNGFLYVYGGTSTGTNSLATVQYSQIGTNGVPGAFTTSANSLGTPRSYVAGAVYNGYLYALGGYNGGSLANTEYAQIGSNGVPGAWAPATPLPNVRDSFAAVASAGYIYILGGYSSSTGSLYNDVYYAQLNANGTIDSTWTQTSSFTTARENLWSLVINNYIYIGDGSTNGSTYYADVQSAPINKDGSLGSFVTNTSVTTARRNASAVYYNGYLYVQGGYSATYLATTQSALVNNGGSGAAGSWTTNSTDLTGPYGVNGWAYGEVVAANGYLYTIGGYTSTGGVIHADNYYAPIASNGSVGSWTATSTLNTGRYAFGMAVYNGYVYVMDGRTGGSTDTNTVEYAPILSTGGLGTWTYGTPTLAGSGARIYATGAAYNGYVYMLGGQHGATNYNDVQYASITSNGSLGAWATTTSFTTARLGHRSIAYNGYLYVIGGYDGTNYLTDIQYAPINSDGTITSWAYTTSLTAPRAYFNISAANGYLYVLGGTNAVGGLTELQYAPINANGTLGNWQMSLIKFTNSRSMPAATLYNGTLYLVGGYAGTTFRTDIQYTPLSAIARVGHYTKLMDLKPMDFGTAVSVNGITYNGTPASLIKVRAAGTSLTTFGNLIAASSIGTTAASCTQLGISDTRYLWVSITLDDSTRGVFADANGPAANLTDFTVSYTPVHAAPNIRLRAGQTLQNGNLSGLDTCGS